MIKAQFVSYSWKKILKEISFWCYINEPKVQLTYGSSDINTWRLILGQLNFRLVEHFLLKNV